MARTLDDDQLSLFMGATVLERTYAEAQRLRQQLPPGVHFGTSSWAYPGWVGHVYPAARSEAWLAREGLRLYARHPLLTTVGLDRTYYAPVPVGDFLRYDAQLPEGFRCCIKMPASVASPIVPGSDRAGTPRANPDFLSPHRLAVDLTDRLLTHFARRLGPVMLEVPRVPAAFLPRSEEFCSRLAVFLAALPSELSIAVELRERSLFTPRYLKVLRAYGASHVYNWWTAMPDLDVQREHCPPEAMREVVLRLVVPPGTRYEARKRALAPFDRVVDPSPSMRASVVAILRRAVAAGRLAWVLVNNKAEGCSPATVMALARGYVHDSTADDGASLLSSST
jgi:uncharacterized protein YecE (DUF72 family)